ncbi:MAG: hypothetical protein K8S87_01455, partial [Planctomycetes bacterium]|nr:hypothetical protein [Planctomycetota bacterium]
EKTFADVEILEGEEGAVGMNVGDEREIKIRMPERFVIPQYSGKEGSVKVKVLQVQSEIEREIDDELAKTVNIDTLDDLKKQILEDLTSAYKNAQRAGLTKEITKQYVDSFDFEFPTKFMENMTEETKTRTKYDLSMKLYQKDPKIEKEELQKKVDEELAEKEEEIINNMIHELRSDFIFKKIADTERIFVTEEEYNMSVYQMAYQYQMNPEQMIKTIEERNMESQIRNDLLTNKVKDHFYSKASFEDIEEVYTPPEHDHDHENHDHDHDEHDDEEHDNDNEN